ncbi:DUF1667 domain-containing protein [Eubacterium sp. 1001713B170207_170306_E7]|uniref:DUF1667 domain-containing protein n=1 Tax=Eubacterium sp. 1001713B170207_170306_E7 TaxID=2787097 RepID=UPI00189BB2C2|nr:DUF1667 domain-containing protein [Eubacterium sp. 1001713B170207_170306_E7]
MREMTCITCPNGCRLTVEETEGRIVVTGNQCPKGEAFAISELTNPMRTISTTVRTTSPAVPVVPVRVSGEIPKARIFEVMAAINRLTVTAPVGRGAVLAADVLGLGVDVVVTSDVLAASVKGEKHES